MADLEKSDHKSFAERLQLEGLWFNERHIWLDGYNFKRCRFDKCIIIAGTHNFELEDCYVDDSNFVYLAGEIVKPVRLLNSIRSGSLTRDSHYQANTNDNRTVTIKTESKPNA